MLVYPLDKWMPGVQPTVPRAGTSLCSWYSQNQHRVIEWLEVLHLLLVCSGASDFLKEPKSIRTQPKASLTLLSRANPLISSLHRFLMPVVPWFLYNGFQWSRRGIFFWLELDVSSYTENPVNFHKYRHTTFPSWLHKHTDMI